MQKKNNRIETLENILNYIKQIYPLESKNIDLLIPMLELKQMEKGETLFSPQRKHHYISFIEKGIVRAFTHHEGKEKTFWLGLEGDVVFPYYTYLKGDLSYETVELLEHCTFYEISIKAFKKLFLENPEWATWGRRFAETQMVMLEEKFIAYQFKSARERYEDLLKSRPELLQRIKLGHLASFLGMSQVSLSRIRAGLQ